MWEFLSPKYCCSGGGPAALSGEYLFELFVQEFTGFSEGGCEAGVFHSEGHHFFLDGGFASGIGIEGSGVGFGLSAQVYFIIVLCCPDFSGDVVSDLAVSVVASLRFSPSVSLPCFLLLKCCSTEHSSSSISALVAVLGMFGGRAHTVG